MQLAVVKFLPDQRPDKINQLKNSILISLFLKIPQKNKILSILKRPIHELSNFSIILLQRKSIIYLRDILGLFFIQQVLVDQMIVMLI